MGIFKRYKELRESDRNRTKRYMLVFIVCILVHTILVVMFSILDKPMLVCLNIISLLFYFVEIERFSFSRLGVVDLTLFYLDTVLHASICNVVLGGNYGFSMYGLMVIPVTFYLSSQEKNISHPVLGSFILSILDAGAMAATTAYSYIHDSNTAGYTVLVVYCINIMLCSLALVLYSQRFLQDIHHAQKGLNYLASYDELTGLRNRHNIQKDLERMNEGVFSISIGDIDNFKNINDTYGHSCGDVVLQTIAKVLKDSTRESDIICRWGGEEFLIAVRQDLSCAVEIVERIRKKVEQTMMDLDGKAVQVAMTFGVAVNSETDSMDKLLVLADKRLYYGKNHGKNQVVYEKQMERKTV